MSFLSKIPTSSIKKYAGKAAKVAKVANVAKITAKTAKNNIAEDATAYNGGQDLEDENFFWVNEQEDFETMLHSGNKKPETTKTEVNDLMGELRMIEELREATEDSYKHPHVVQMEKYLAEINNKTDRAQLPEDRSNGNEEHEGPCHPNCVQCQLEARAAEKAHRHVASFLKFVDPGMIPDRKGLNELIEKYL
ncbi:hypothetical protein NW768_007381 [Fusarium equiseti]|uniref:Uncharacterized protein n=1 Tax=Fusarium equiseti TaxID=61235 RepID=A0ABQ8R7C0_FUSEQ|nr:hypothetical protein NW768_007381 [Fusarium equiseti]